MIDINKVSRYYNNISEFYKFFHDDWENQVSTQGQKLHEIIQKNFQNPIFKIADVSCGIGTQCLELPKYGYSVYASDISDNAVEVAIKEAERRSVEITFSVKDMRDISADPNKCFDIIISAGNSLPHLLSEAEIIKTLSSFKKALNPDGGCILGIRDYSKFTKNQIMHRTLHKTQNRQVLLFDVIDFKENLYDFDTYIVVEEGKEIKTYKFSNTYMVLSIERLKELMRLAGFHNIRVLRKGFYQPLFIGFA